MPQADADAADRAHPPENLNFTVVFSLDQSIDDKEPRLHDAFDHLGLRQRNFCDVCYAVRVPRSQLMMPPVPHLHWHWVDFSDELQPDSCYFLILFSRRLHDLIKDNTMGSDFQINLVPDGAFGCGAFPADGLRRRVWQTLPSCRSHGNPLGDRPQRSDSSLWPNRHDRRAPCGPLPRCGAPVRLTLAILVPPCRLCCDKCIWQKTTICRF